MSRARRYLIPAAAVVAAILIIVWGKWGFTGVAPASRAAVSNKGVTVHFLDVGQGDSEFIELPGGKCMLIDASLGGYGQEIADIIKSLGYSRVDYIVVTHPHADHIGGMAEVISEMDTGEIYMPYAVTSTQIYEDFIQMVSDMGLEINSASAGREIYSSSDLEIGFLAPSGDSYNELNNYSAVVKLTYGENSFLFTGDAEFESEQEMLADFSDELNADVLKVAHHGSSSSSGSDFLAAVSPKYAVISCGEGNSYGHPHSETLRALNDCGADVYRTDEMGTITVGCDGTDGYSITYGD